MKFGHKAANIEILHCIWLCTRLTRRNTLCLLICCVPARVRVVNNQSCPWGPRAPEDQRAYGPTSPTLSLGYRRESKRGQRAPCHHCKVLILQTKTVEPNRTQPYVLLLLPIALQGATLIMMLANPNNKTIRWSRIPSNLSFLVP